MSSSLLTKPFARPSITRTVVVGLSLVTLVAVACSITDMTTKEKNYLNRFGTIEAEWEERNDAEEKTHTYILLRNESGRFETHEIVSVDGRREIERELIGGIDATGCFLLPNAMSTPWIEKQTAEVLEDSRKSGERTRTACLEYKETEAWNYVPAEDRKAAEPPPPEPKETPAPGPDAGTSDAGGTDSTTEPSASEEEEGDSIDSVLP